MITKYKHKNITWVDIEAPNRSEIIDLTDEFKIPKLIGEELLTETLKSKVDHYEKEGVIYAVLHFPFYDKEKSVVTEKEIDFILGKNFLITTHYHQIDPLNNFSKIFDNESLLDVSKIGDNPGFLFFFILKHLYKFMDMELDNIGTNLEKIENDIFNDKERSAVNTISLTNRKIIRFKKALSFHSQIIKSIEPVGSEMYGSAFSFNMTMIMSEYYKVNSTISWYKELLDDMRTTNDSLLTTKSNDTIKTLTILTFMLFPVALITQILGMNIGDENHIIQDRNDFYAVVSLMMLIGILMYAYFRGKKWL